MSEVQQEASKNFTNTIRRMGASWPFVLGFAAIEALVEFVVGDLNNEEDLANREALDSNYVYKVIAAKGLQDSLNFSFWNGFAHDHEALFQKFDMK